MASTGFHEVTATVRAIEAVTSGPSGAAIQRKAGMAAKKAALDVAGEKLGSDRSFSGWRRKVALGAGFDEGSGSTVVLNLRPAGLWTLAESGRKASDKLIVPRRRSGKQALRTPQGPRASARITRSRGLKAITDAVERAAAKSHDAAADQTIVEIRKVVH